MIKGIYSKIITGTLLRNNKQIRKLRFAFDISLLHHFLVLVQGGNDLDKDSLVKSVDRALHLINLLSHKKDGYGVTELAKQVGLHKSSVYRILTTMMQHQFVEQDAATGRYKLGYKVVELGAKLLDSIDLRTEAKPFLIELEQLTQEVVHLVVINLGQVVYIEKLEGTQTLRMHSKVGNRAPVHCTSVGKAILAYLETQEIDRIIEEQGLPQHTPHTIVDKQDLLAELKKIKAQGYALDLEENEIGITCIAVPIFDHREMVVAAVSISGATMRMTEERLDQLKRRMMETGQQISRRLGFTGQTI
jgi:IclR family KDG regulon transcriptional repressor